MVIIRNSVPSVLKKFVKAAHFNFFLWAGGLARVLSEVEIPVFEHIGAGTGTKLKIPV
jgi:hypothetical protein